MRDRTTRWARRAVAPVLAVTVVGLGAVVVATSDGRDAALGRGLPETPAGEQLAWVLAQLNGEASGWDEAEVARHVSAEFLDLFAPPAQVVELFRQTARERGPLTFTGFAQPPRPEMVVALVRTRQGESAAVRVRVERGGGGRIVDLEIGDAPPVVVAAGRFSGSFDVGGRKLFVRCTGAGGPTVVLEGGTTADWFDVQNRLAATTRVCSYDRATAAWSRSDAAPTPRTAGDLVADLRAVLAAAGVPRPYVLAGHSNGGLFVQLYAALHPDEVAGLVLIDAVHVDYHDRRQALLERLAPGPGGPGQGPRRPPPRPVFLDPGQKILLDESLAEVRAARQRALPLAVPLVVLSHGRPDPDDLPPASPERADEELWRSLQAELAQLAPGARHIVVDGSGHDIPAEGPDEVTEAVRQVVAAARAGGRAERA